MRPDGSAPEDGTDAEEATAAVETGRRGQRLICEGWFAGHAGSGTPGPHVHLRTSDGQDPVPRTDQVAGLAEALSVVAGRIERMWEVDGAEYAEKVVLRSPDPQDLEVSRQRNLERLRLTQRLCSYSLSRGVNSRSNVISQPIESEGRRGDGR